MCLYKQYVALQHLDTLQPKTMHMRRGTPASRHATTNNKNGVTSLCTCKTLSNTCEHGKYDIKTVMIMMSELIIGKLTTKRRLHLISNRVINIYTSTQLFGSSLCRGVRRLSSMTSHRDLVRPTAAGFIVY